MVNTSIVLCFTVYAKKVACADQTVNINAGITQPKTQVEGRPSRA